MIFLFANQGYGAPFVRTAIAWCRSNCVSLILVRSFPRRRMHSVRKAAVWTIESLKHRTSVQLVESVNEDRFWSRIPQGSVGIITGFNQVFKQEIIDRFSELVNFHPSLLPFYRGPIPSYWCLVNREKRSGFTLHQVTEKLDAGRIYFQNDVEIHPDDTPAMLDGRIAACAQPTMVAYLEHVVTGAEWVGKSLDAGSIYLNRVDYRSFPAQ